MKRFSAALTLIFFLFHEAAFAAPALILPGAFSDREMIPKTWEGLQIPDSLGTIRDVFDAPSGTKKSRAVVVLEDAHASVSAQENIRKILKRLSRRYGFENILIEGAVADLDPRTFHFFGGRQLDTKTARLLVQDGLAGGPELFLLEESYRPQAKARGLGIEEAALYRKNIAAYRHVLKNRVQSKTFLEQTRALLAETGCRIFGKELKDFFRENLGLYSEQVPDAGRFRVLSAFAQKVLRLDLTAAANQAEWPQLVRFYKSAALEARLDPEKIRRDGLRLQERMQQMGWEDALTRGVSRLAGFDRGRRAVFLRRPRSFFEKFYREAARHGLDLEEFPDFREAAGARILRSELEVPALFGEVEKLTQKIIDALAVTPQEKKLSDLCRRLALLRKTLLLELTSREFAGLKKRPKDFQPSAFLKELAALSAPGKTPEAGPLDGIFSKARRFYEQASLRDGHMVAKCIQTLEARGLQKAVLFAGGYHTAGITRRLKKAGISYLVITPRLEGSLETAASYQSGMLRQPDSHTQRSHLRTFSRMQSLSQTIQPLLGRGEAAYAAYGLNSALGRVVAAEKLDLAGALRRINRGGLSGHGLSYRLEGQKGILNFKGQPLLWHGQSIGITPAGPALFPPAPFSSSNFQLPTSNSSFHFSPFSSRSEVRGRTFEVKEDYGVFTDMTAMRAKAQQLLKEGQFGFFSFMSQSMFFEKHMFVSWDINEIEDLGGKPAEFLQQLITVFTSWYLGVELESFLKTNEPVEIHLYKAEVVSAQTRENTLLMVFEKPDLDMDEKADGAAKARSEMRSIQESLAAMAELSQLDRELVAIETDAQRFETLMRRADPELAARYEQMILRGDVLVAALQPLTGESPEVSASVRMVAKQNLKLLQAKLVRWREKNQQMLQRSSQDRARKKMLLTLLLLHPEELPLSGILEPAQPVIKRILDEFNIAEPDRAGFLAAAEDTASLLKPNGLLVADPAKFRVILEDFQPLGYVDIREDNEMLELQIPEAVLKEFEPSRLEMLARLIPAKVQFVFPRILILVDEDSRDQVTPAMIQTARAHRAIRNYNARRNINGGLELPAIGQLTFLLNLTKTGEDTWEMPQVQAILDQLNQGQKKHGARDEDFFYIRNESTEAKLEETDYTIIAEKFMLAPQVKISGVRSVAISGTAHDGSDFAVVMKYFGRLRDDPRAPWRFFYAFFGPADPLRDVITDFFIVQENPGGVDPGAYEKNERAQWIAAYNEIKKFEPVWRAFQKFDSEDLSEIEDWDGLLKLIPAVPAGGQPKGAKLERLENLNPIMTFLYQINGLFSHDFYFVDNPAFESGSGKEVIEFLRTVSDENTSKVRVERFFSALLKYVRRQKMLAVYGDPAQKPRAEERLDRIENFIFASRYFLQARARELKQSLPSDDIYLRESGRRIKDYLLAPLDQMLNVMETLVPTPLRDQPAGDDPEFSREVQRSLKPLSPAWIVLRTLWRQGVLTLEQAGMLARASEFSTAGGDIHQSQMLAQDVAGARRTTPARVSEALEGRADFQRVVPLTQTLEKFLMESDWKTPVAETEQLLTLVDAAALQTVISASDKQWLRMLVDKPEDFRREILTQQTGADTLILQLLKAVRAMRRQLAGARAQMQEAFKDQKTSAEVLLARPKVEGFEKLYALEKWLAGSGEERYDLARFLQEAGYAASEGGLVSFHSPLVAEKELLPVAEIRSRVSSAIASFFDLSTAGYAAWPEFFKAMKESISASVGEANLLRARADLTDPKTDFVTLLANENQIDEFSFALRQTYMTLKRRGAAINFQTLTQTLPEFFPEFNVMKQGAAVTPRMRHLNTLLSEPMIMEGAPKLASREQAEQILKTLAGPLQYLAAAYYRLIEAHGMIPPDRGQIRYELERMNVDPRMRTDIDRNFEVYKSRLDKQFQSLGHAPFPVAGQLVDAVAALMLHAYRQYQADPGPGEFNLDQLVQMIKGQGQGLAAFDQDRLVQFLTSAEAGESLAQIYRLNPDVKPVFANLEIEVLGIMEQAETRRQQAAKDQQRREKIAEFEKRDYSTDEVAAAVQTLEALLLDRDWVLEDSVAADPEAYAVEMLESFFSGNPKLFRLALQSAGLLDVDLKVYWVFVRAEEDLDQTPDLAELKTRLGAAKLPLASHASEAIGSLDRLNRFLGSPEFKTAEMNYLRGFPEEEDNELLEIYKGQLPYPVRDYTEFLSKIAARWASREDRHAEEGMTLVHQEVEMRLFWNFDLGQTEWQVLRAFRGLSNGGKQAVEAEQIREALRKEDHLPLSVEAIQEISEAINQAFADADLEAPIMLAQKQGQGTVRPIAYVEAEDLYERFGFGLNDKAPKIWRAPPKSEVMRVFTELMGHLVRESRTDEIRDLKRVVSRLTQASLIPVVIHYSDSKRPEFEQKMVSAAEYKKLYRYLRRSEMRGKLKVESIPGFSRPFSNWEEAKTHAETLRQREPFQQVAVVFLDDFEDRTVTVFDFSDAPELAVSEKAMLSDILGIVYENYVKPRIYPVKPALVARMPEPESWKFQFGLTRMEAMPKTPEKSTLIIFVLTPEEKAPLKARSEVRSFEAIAADAARISRLETEEQYDMALQLLEQTDRQMRALLAAANGDRAVQMAARWSLPRLASKRRGIETKRTESLKRRQISQDRQLLIFAGLLSPSSPWESRQTELLDRLEIAQAQRDTFLAEAALIIPFLHFDLENASLPVFGLEQAELIERLQNEALLHPLEEFPLQIKDTEILEKIGSWKPEEEVGSPTLREVRSWKLEVGSEDRGEAGSGLPTSNFQLPTFSDEFGIAFAAALEELAVTLAAHHHELNPEDIPGRVEDYRLYIRGLRSMLLEGRGLTASVFAEKIGMAGAVAQAQRRLDIFRDSLWAQGLSYFELVKDDFVRKAKPPELTVRKRSYQKTLFTLLRDVNAYRSLYSKHGKVTEPLFDQELGLSSTAKRLAYFTKTLLPVFERDNGVWRQLTWDLEDLRTHKPNPIILQPLKVVLLSEDIPAEIPQELSSAAARDSSPVLSDENANGAALSSTSVIADSGDETDHSASGTHPQFAVERNELTAIDTAPVFSPPNIPSNFLVQSLAEQLVRRVGQEAVPLKPALVKSGVLSPEVMLRADELSAPQEPFDYIVRVLLKEGGTRLSKIVAIANVPEEVDQQLQKILFQIAALMRGVQASSREFRKEGLLSGAFLDSSITPNWMAHEANDTMEILALLRNGPYSLDHPSVRTIPIKTLMLLRQAIRDSVSLIRPEMNQVAQGERTNAWLVQLVRKIVAAVEGAGAADLEARLNAARQKIDNLERVLVPEDLDLLAAGAELPSSVILSPLKVLTADEESRGTEALRYAQDDTKEAPFVPATGEALEPLDFAARKFLKTKTFDPSAAADPAFFETSPEIDQQIRLVLFQAAAIHRGTRRREPLNDFKTLESQWRAFRTTTDKMAEEAWQTLRSIAIFRNGPYSVIHPQVRNLPVLDLLLFRQAVRDSITRHAEEFDKNTVGQQATASALTLLMRLVETPLKDPRTAAVRYADRLVAAKAWVDGLDRPVTPQDAAPLEALFQSEAAAETGSETESTALPELERMVLQMAAVEKDFINDETYTDQLLQRLRVSGVLPPVDAKTKEYESAARILLDFRNGPGHPELSKLGFIKILRLRKAVRSTLAQETAEESDETIGARSAQWTVRLVQAVLESRLPIEQNEYGIRLDRVFHWVERLPQHRWNEEDFQRALEVLNIPSIPGSIEVERVVLADDEGTPVQPDGTGPALRDKEDPLAEFLTLVSRKGPNDALSRYKTVYDTAQLRKRAEELLMIGVAFKHTFWRTTTFKALITQIQPVYNDAAAAPEALKQEIAGVLAELLAARHGAYSREHPEVLHLSMEGLLLLQRRFYFNLKKSDGAAPQEFQQDALVAQSLQRSLQAVRQVIEIPLTGQERQHLSAGTTTLKLIYRTRLVRVIELVMAYKQPMTEAQVLSVADNFDAAALPDQNFDSVEPFRFDLAKSPAVVDAQSAAKEPLEELLLQQETELLNLFAKRGRAALYTLPSETKAQVILWQSQIAALVLGREWDDDKFDRPKIMRHDVWENRSTSLEVKDEAHQALLALAQVFYGAEGKEHPEVRQLPKKNIFLLRQAIRQTLQLRAKETPIAPDDYGDRATALASAVLQKIITTPQEKNTTTVPARTLFEKRLEQSLKFIRRLDHAFYEADLAGIFRSEVRAGFLNGALSEAVWKTARDSGWVFSEKVARRLGAEQLKFVPLAFAQDADWSLQIARQAELSLETIRHFKEILVPLVRLRSSLPDGAVDELFETAAWMIDQNKAKAGRVVFIADDASHADLLADRLKDYLQKKKPEHAAQIQSRLSVVSESNRFIRHLIPRSAKTVWLDWAVSATSQKRSSYEQEIQANRLRDGRLLALRLKQGYYGASLLQAVKLLLEGPEQSGLVLSKEGIFVQVSGADLASLGRLLSAMKALAASA